MASYPELPDISPIRVEAIAAAAAGDPDYLTRPACPYGPGIKRLLAGLVAPPAPAPAVEAELDALAAPLAPNVFAGLAPEGQIDMILANVEGRISSLEVLARRMDDPKTDLGMQLKYQEVSAKLIERWTTISTKLHAAREVNLFKARVLEALSDLSAEQRAAFIDKLKESAR